MLVLSVLALAAVCGFALLTSSSIQAQMGSNSANSCSADYLAESGLQAAMYYLQYPQLMPVAWGTTAGHAIHATNQQIGGALPGSFDVDATERSTRDEYDITATGRSSSGGASRSATARVRVDRTKVQGAGYFGGPITIPARTNLSGFVQVNGNLNNTSGFALASTSLGPLPPTAYATPTIGTINYYGAGGDGIYTTPDGNTGHAQQLLAAPTSNPTAAANNPGKIFYYIGDLTLASTIGIDGTLIVKNGSLTIKAAGINIRAASGYPALIVERDLTMFRTSVSLEINGLAWIGRNIIWTGPSNTGSSLTINGALLMPANSIINPPTIGASTTVNATANEIEVPYLTVTKQPGKNVKILTWNQ